jgi:Ankyrin repeats (3 copies)
VADRVAKASERIRADDLTEAGVVLTMVILIFTARVVCEQTFVTWAYGVQQMEFSPPQFGLDWIGVFCVISGILWALAVVILSITRSQRVSPTNRWLIALIILCVGLWLVPYEQWKLLMVRAHGAQRIPRDWIVWAAASGEIRLLDDLLANGVDVNTRIQTGQSPLGAAAAEGQMNAARLLIAHGARLENRTVFTLETPLIEAAQANHIDMVKLLLEHGADPIARDVMGLSALGWAQKNANSEIVRLLQARSRD